MYNEQMEGLISAALADGVLTEKEKQILFKKAQSMGIDLDEFEMVLDARLVEQKKEEARNQQQHDLEMEKAKAAQKSAPKSDKFGDVRKCPACGAMLGSFQTTCPDCGHEFTNVGAVNSAKQLFDALQAVEMRKAEKIAAHNRDRQQRFESLSQKHNSDGAFVKLLGGQSRKERQESERESLNSELNEEKENIEKMAIAEKQNIIKSFPVPNTKEDLMELLAMATSGAYDNDGVIGPEEEVWIQKTDQIYQKIIVCAASDRKTLEQATAMIFSLIKRLPKPYKKFTRIPPELQGKLQEEMASNRALVSQKKDEVNKKRGLPALGALVAAILFFFLFAGQGSVICLIIFVIAIIAFVFYYKKWKKEREEAEMFS